MDDKRTLLQRRSTQEKAAIGKGSLNASFIFDVCRNGDHNTLKEILNQRKDIIKLRDQNNRTLLHYCSESKDTQCAQLLLEASPELLTHQDNDGYSVLHLAVINSNKQLLRFLCQQFGDGSKKESFVNCVDSEGHTPFHWATVCSDIECLEILYNEGASAAIPDNHGAYPLHYASQLCGVGDSTHKSDKIRIELLKKLLSFSNVDVNCKDNDGRTPLLWASSAGNCEAILILINANADIAEQDNDGLTALHCAASRGFVECVETLLTLGAEIDQMDANGCSPLFYAVTLGHADCVHVLLQNGAEPNRQDCKGRTAAHCGAAKSQLETLKILAQHGANLWMRNVRGDLPLHDAIKSGRKELVWWLLHQRPESVNITNTFGRTPLHLAAINNNVELCKVLIDSGADVNAVMKTKGHLMTPLDAALQRGYRSCGKFLLLHGALPSNKLNLSNKQSRFGVSGESSDTKRSDIGVSVSLLNERVGTDSTNSRTESSATIRGINLPALHHKEPLTSSKRIQVFTEDRVSPDFRDTSRSPNEPIVRNQSIITNVYLQSGSGKRIVPPLQKKVKKTVVRHVETVSEKSETSGSAAVVNDIVSNEEQNGSSSSEERKKISKHSHKRSSNEESFAVNGGYTLTDDSFIREDITIDLSSRDEGDIPSDSRDYILINPHTSHLQAIGESSATYSEERRCIRRSSDGAINYTHLSNGDGKVIIILNHSLTPFTNEDETRIIEIDERSNDGKSEVEEQKEERSYLPNETKQKDSADEIEREDDVIVNTTSSSEKKGKEVEKLRTSEIEMEDAKNKNLESKEDSKSTSQESTSSKDKKRSLIPRISTTSSTKSKITRQTNVEIEKQSETDTHSNKRTTRTERSTELHKSSSLNGESYSNKDTDTNIEDSSKLKGHSSIDSVSSKRTPRVSASNSMKSKCSTEHADSIKSGESHETITKSNKIKRRSRKEYEKQETEPENGSSKRAQKFKSGSSNYSGESDQHEEHESDVIEGHQNKEIDEDNKPELYSTKKPPMLTLTSSSTKSEPLSDQKEFIKRSEGNEINGETGAEDENDRPHDTHVDTINNNYEDERCEICSKRNSIVQNGDQVEVDNDQHSLNAQPSLHSIKSKRQLLQSSDDECDEESDGYSDHESVGKKEVNKCIDTMSNEDNNFDDRESDDMHDRRPDMSSMKSKFGQSLPTNKSSVMSHTTMSEHAKKSTDYERRQQQSQRTSSFDGSILTETSRIDTEPINCQSRMNEDDDEKEDIANNYHKDPTTETVSDFKARDETLHDVQSIQNEHRDDEFRGHLINGYKSERKQWSKEGESDDINLSVTKKERKEIITDKKREENCISEINVNYEIAATVDNESADESSSGCYNKELAQFGSDTDSDHEANALDDELNEHLRRIRQATTRFELNNGWELQREGYEKDSMKTVSKSRSDSRCSHKLHYKSNRAHVGSVDLSRVTAKVDTRGAHLLRNDRRAFDGKHKCISRCNCVPADIDGREILQTMEKSLRKYQVERNLFEELQSLKRCQIRTSRANEALLVKRLAEKFKREIKVPGLREFSGAFTYKNYEKFLYDQLRLLSSSNQQKVLPLITAVSDENISLSCLKQALDTSNHLDNCSQISNVSRKGSFSAGHLSTFDTHKNEDDYFHDENSLLDISSLPSIAGQQSPPPEYRVVPTEARPVNKMTTVDSKNNRDRQKTATKQTPSKKQSKLTQQNDITKKEVASKDIKLKKLEKKPSNKEVKGTVKTIQKPIKPNSIKKNALSNLDKPSSNQNLKKVRNEAPAIKPEKYQFKTTAKYEQMLQMRQQYRRECLKPEERIEPLEAARNRPKFKRTKMNIPLKEDICVASDEIAERWQRIKSQERNKLKQMRKASSCCELRFIYVLGAPKKVESLQSNSLMDRHKYGRRPISRTQSDSRLHVSPVYKR